MLAARRRAGTLPKLSLLALGANGPVSDAMIDQALRAVGPGRLLGLVTPRRSPVTETSMRRAARRHPGRVLVVDWVSFSAGRAGWFAGDGLHVTHAAARQFSRFVARKVAPIADPPRTLRPPRHSTGSQGLRQSAPDRPSGRGTDRSRGGADQLQARPRAGADHAGAAGARVAVILVESHRTRAVDRPLPARGPQGARSHDGAAPRQTPRRQVTLNVPRRRRGSRLAAPTPGLPAPGTGSRRPTPPGSRLSAWIAMRFARPAQDQAVRPISGTYPADGCPTAAAAEMRGCAARL